MSLFSSFLIFSNAFSSSRRNFLISFVYICKSSFDMSEFLTSSMSIPGFALFGIGVLLVTGTGSSKLNSEIVEANDTVFQTSTFFTSKLELSFSLSLLMQHFLLDIFPEPEHFSLLFVADWYHFNLHFDFDASRPDLYINIEG